jgi:hypothetical protein
VDISILQPSVCPDTGRTKYKTKRFNIKGRDIQCDIDIISITDEGKLYIAQQYLQQSPSHKVKKHNTTMKNVHDNIEPQSNAKKALFQNTEALDMGCRVNIATGATGWSFFLCR